MDRNIASISPGEGNVPIVTPSWLRSCVARSAKWASVPPMRPTNNDTALKPTRRMATMQAIVNTPTARFHGNTASIRLARE